MTEVPVLDARAAADPRAGRRAGLGAVAPDAWDRLVGPGRGPFRHAFLAACEPVALDGFALEPLVVRAPDGPGDGAGPGDGEAPVAAHAPAYLYDLDLGLFARGLGARLISLLRRLRPRALRRRVLEVGCPVALGDPFSVARGADEAAAVGALVDLAGDAARRGAADLVVVRDLEPDGGAAAKALASRGFEAVPLPPSFVLDLDGGFDSFEGYLAALRSDYRRRARLRLERAAGLAVERLAGPGFGPIAGELARLWRCVYERADEYRREVLPEAFFRGIARLPAAGVLVLRRPDRSIAAFALLLDDRPWLRFLYSGCEAEAARREGAYFRLLYEIVRTGIEGGYRRVELGITTAEPKLDLGARPVPLEAWIRHRSPFSQALIGRALRSVLAPRPVAPRRAFRTEGP